MEVKMKSLDVWGAIETKMFSLLESDTINKSSEIQITSSYACSPLFHAVYNCDYTASEHRRLLLMGYRPADPSEAFSLAIEMLWKGWSVGGNMPKAVFGLEWVDRESLSEECVRICKLIPSKRIYILKGLAILGADVGVMENVANDFMILEEMQKLRSAFAGIRSNSER